MSSTPSLSTTPVTKYLLLNILLTSLAAIALQAPPTFSLKTLLTNSPLQLFRLAFAPLTTTHPPTLLLSLLSLYQLRPVEQLWGSRKFASFLLAAVPLNTLLTPLVQLLLPPLPSGHPTTANATRHVPFPGPTPLVLSLAAQFHVLVPPVWRYEPSRALSFLSVRRFAQENNNNSSNNNNNNRESESDPVGVEITSKWTSYIIPLQLALSQFPGSLVGAAVGWSVGKAWRVGLVPGAGWRVGGRRDGGGVVDDGRSGSSSASKKER